MGESPALHRQEARGHLAARQLVLAGPVLISFVEQVPIGRFVQQAVSREPIGRVSQGRSGVPEVAGQASKVVAEGPGLGRAAMDLRGPVAKEPRDRDEQSFEVGERDHA